MNAPNWIVLAILAASAALAGPCARGAGGDSAVRAGSAGPATAWNPEASVSATADTTETGRLALLPIIFSGPDTGYAFGALPQYVFQTAPDARPSNLRADLYYTEKGQFNFQFTPEIWFPGNASSLRARLQFRDWPTSFYGTAPPAFEESESFDERLVTASVEGQRRIRASAYVGASYRFRWASVTPDSAALRLSEGDVRGVGRSRISGLGIVASWDSRNHVYLPTRGAQVKLSAEWYTSLLGSSYDFALLTADLRAYRGFGARHAFAAQLKATSTVGEGPFRLLPGVGEVLRGYGSTRHVGNHRWAAQVEYRAIPVVWRLGFVAFAGVGDTADRWDEFGGDVWYTVGAGVRFLVYRSLKITIRQDFGFGRDSSGDYLDLNEAF